MSAKPEQHLDAMPQPAAETGSGDTASSPIAAFERLRLDRKRALVLLLLGVLTVALLLAAGDGRSALIALTQADWRLVGLAVLIHYSGFVVRGHRWQLLLRMLGYRFSYLYLAGLLLSGWFISALLPARSGDIFRVGVLRMPPAASPVVPVADGVGSIVLERALDILAILLLGAAFGFVVLQGQLPGWVVGGYAIALLILAGLGLALLLAPSLLAWLRRWSSARWWHVGLDFALQLVTGLRKLPHFPGLAVVVIAESLYIWLCDALLLWLILRSLGAQVTFGSAAFVALTVDVFAAVPLTPGGVGQVEAAYAALLALLPAAAVSIAAVVLVTRAISYWSFLMVSGIVAFTAGFAQLVVGGAAAAPDGSQRPDPTVATGTGHGQ